MSDAADLDGRVAVVTGAGGGIGAAVVRALGAAGATVVAADIDRGRAEVAAAAIPRGVAAVADIADEQACQELVAGTIADHGSVDILVNNAGLQHVEPIATFPTERWDLIMATMARAPFILTRASLPSMIGRGWGRIVNIGSVHALVASPNKVAYIAAKHAVLGLTRVTALEAGEHGVTANLVCPAYVRTPLVDGQIADQARTLGIPESEVVSEVMLAPSSIKRLIEPDEVAGVVRFLCSDAAAMITGSVQVIDGGWTAR
jgi:3-hydroxybutyrate dehydrogenase